MAKQATNTNSNVDRIVQVSSDDTFSTEMSVATDKDIVNTKFAVKPSGKDGSPRFGVLSTLDFSNVTREELLQLASRPVIIDLQRQFRVMYLSDGNGQDTATRVATWKTIDVKHDIIDAKGGPRKPVDPKKAVLSNFAKLSPEDQADIIAQMQAQQ